MFQPYEGNKHINNLSSSSLLFVPDTIISPLRTLLLPRRRRRDSTRHNPLPYPLLPHNLWLPPDSRFDAKVKSLTEPVKDHFLSIPLGSCLLFSGTLDWDHLRPVGPGDCKGVFCPVPVPFYLFIPTFLSFFRGSSQKILLKLEVDSLLQLGAEEEVPLKFKGGGFYSHFLIPEKKGR